MSSLIDIDIIRAHIKHEGAQAAIKGCWCSNLKSSKPGALPISDHSSEPTISLELIDKNQFAIVALPFIPNTWGSLDVSTCLNHTQIEFELRVIGTFNKRCGLAVKLGFNEPNKEYRAGLFLDDYYQPNDQWQKINLPLFYFDPDPNAEKTINSVRLLELIAYNDVRYEIRKLKIISKQLTNLPKLSYSWQYRNNYPVQKFFENSNGRVLLTAGISHNVEWMPYIKSTDHIISALPFGPSYDDFLRERKTLLTFGQNLEHWYILCNTQWQVKRCHELGMQGFLVNNNSFLDEKRFKYDPSVAKQYDAIYVARTIACKRHELLTKVNNLALVVGNSYTSDVVDISYLKPAYRNPEPLLPMEVLDKIREAHIGLMLSAQEGACYSSSEYLLSGIPVVSTISDGGRDFWYTEDNSIICEPTPDAVASSIETMLGRIRNREIDPMKIRSDHIALMWSQRTELARILGTVFRKLDATIDPYNYLLSKLCHKLMENYITMPELKKLLGIAI